jgi:subtilisin
MNKNIHRRGVRRALVPILVGAALLGAGGTAQAGAHGPAPHRQEGSAPTQKRAPAEAEHGRAVAFDQVTRQAKTHGRITVTLTLADAPTQAPDARIRAHLSEQSRAGRAAVLEALDGPAGTHGLPGAPVMTAHVSAADIAALRQEPSVRSIAESQVFEPAGTSTFGAANGVQLPKWWHQKRIGLDWTYANGYNGAGQKVVIVDTGVDSTHPWLRGRVVDGACFSQGGCGNGLTYRYGIGAGAPCSYSYACAHGTHVAHSAAGAYGAARSAGIVAINASTRGTDQYGNPAPRFYDADLINALWYSYNYVSPAPAAINISVGSDAVYSAVCDSRNQSMANWITALRSRGTATVIAAGNSNSASGVSSPACMSSAVVVGNATLTGATGVPAVLGGVRGGSNSSSLIDLWAPGTDICSAVPTSLDGDGVADGVDCSYYGTSMAAPQVTGAFAVMKAARPTYTVSQSLSALQRNGRAITDTRNAITRSMISVSNAVFYG